MVCEIVVWLIVVHLWICQHSFQWSVLIQTYHVPAATGINTSVPWPAFKLGVFAEHKFVSSEVERGGTSRIRNIILGREIQTGIVATYVRTVQA